MMDSGKARCSGRTRPASSPQSEDKTGRLWNTLTAVAGGRDLVHV